jgi:hypothetical protein
MKRLWILFFLYASPLNAQPITGAFTSGSMSSTTTSTQSITETITSSDYNTGYTYSVSGVGISHDGGNMSPSAVLQTGTIGGVNYTWTGADLTTKPNWTQTDVGSGDAFQFAETYQSPGLANTTVIQRTIETESVIQTNSVFTK